MHTVPFTSAVPKVSVIMPAYNSSSTLGQAIRSVQLQTLTDWELIVVDDGSSDDTAVVAQSFADVDPRIQVHKIPRSGRGAARNACLEKARGEYIAVFDADDISSATRLSVQLDLAQSSESDVVSCSTGISFSTDGRHRAVVVLPATEDEIVALFARDRMPLLFASCLIRRTVFTRFGTFDSELHRNQDYGFFKKCFTELRFSTVPLPLLMFRRAHVATGWRHVRENNFYRLLATLRARGDRITAAELKRSALGKMHLNLLAPLQYASHVFKRTVFGSGIRPLTASETQLLDATLAATRVSSGSQNPAC